MFQVRKKSLDPRYLSSTAACRGFSKPHESLDVPGTGLEPALLLKETWS